MAKPGQGVLSPIILTMVVTVFVSACGTMQGNEASQNNATSWIALGEEHLAGGDAQAASRAFRRAQSVAPGNSLARAGLARSYHLMGETEAAERVFRRAISTRGAIAARHYFARFYLAQGDYDSAAPLLKEVLEPVDYPGRTEALVDRGLLALALGNPAVAGVCWERALGRDPAHRAALWHLTHLARVQGRLQQSADYEGAFTRYHADATPALRDSLRQLPGSPAHTWATGARAGELRCE